MSAREGGVERDGLGRRAWASDGDVGPSVIEHESSELSTKEAQVVDDDVNAGGDWV